MASEPFDGKQHNIQKKYVICSLCSNKNNKTVVITDPILDEMICQNCGQVILEKELQISPESVHTGEGEVNSTTDEMSSLRRYSMGVATRIGSVNKDAHGHTLDSAIFSRMGRLRMWDTRVHADTSNHQSLQRAFSKLLNLKDKLMLSNDVVDRIVYIYKKAH